MPQDNQPIYDEEALAALEVDNTEAEGYDEDADYAAPPPPLPDGWHQATLHLIGVKDGDQQKEFSGPRKWGNIPSTFFTQIDASVVDPNGPQNGKRTARFNVTTHAEERRNGASSASLVYRALTGKPLPGLKQGLHMKEVLDALRGNSTVVWIKTQLEGEAADASKAYREAKDRGDDPLPKRPKTFRGEKTFSEGGKLTGRTWDEASGEWVVGRPAIVDIKPASFVPPAKK